jgi:hypothetical protein
VVTAGCGAVVVEVGVVTFGRVVVGSPRPVVEVAGWWAAASAPWPSPGAAQAARDSDTTALRSARRRPEPVA